MHRTLVTNALVFLLLLLIVTTASGQAPSLTELRELPEARMLERELTGTETHSYKIKLKEGELFQVRVEQKGADVVLTIVSAGGRELAQMDSPNGKEGNETLTFVATESGPHILRVSNSDAKAEKGVYTIRREISRTATAKDKRRVEVERLFVAAVDESAVDRTTDTAVKKWKESLAAWRELEDEYMADQAARQLRRSISVKSRAFFEVAKVLVGRGDQKSLKTALFILTEARGLTQEINEKRGEAFCLDLMARVSKSLGDNQQALTYYSQALPLWAELTQKTEEVETLINLGAISFAIGETKKALQYFQQALIPLKDAQNKEGEATILSNIGMCYSALDEKEKAIGYLIKSRSLWHAAKDKKGEGRVLINLGTVHSDMGKMEESLDYYRQALTIFRDVKDRPAEASVLESIGNIYANFEDKRQALEPYEQALLLYRTLDNKERLVAVLDELGFTYVAVGEKETAIKYFVEALPLYKLTPDEWKERRTLANLGSLYLDLGEKKKALESHQRGLELSREANDEEGVGTQLNNVGMVYMVLGERRKARDEYFNEALKVFRDLKDKRREGWTHICLGTFYTDLSDYRRALEHYEQARELYRDSRETGGEINALYLIGLSHSALGDKQRARQIYQEALSIKGSTYSRASLLHGLGKNYLDAGDTQKGLEYITQALVLEVAENKDGEAIFLNSLGDLWQTLGNSRLAIFYQKQAVNKYQELRQVLQTLDHETQKAFLNRLRIIYNSLAISLIEAGRSAEAVQVLNLYRDQRYLDFNRNPEETAKQIELSVREATLAARYEQAAAAVRRTGRKLANLRHRVGDDQPSVQQVAQARILEVEYKTAVDAFVALLDEVKAEFSNPVDVKDKIPAATGVDDLQKTLRDISGATRQKTVILYTIATTEKFHVLLVSGNSIKDFATAAKSKELDEKVLRFYATLRSRRYDPRPLGKYLYDIILKPAEAELRRTGVRTLLWALEGNLRYVPMAALSPDGKGYLVEQYQNVVLTRSEPERMTRPVGRSWTGLGFGSGEARKVKLLGSEINFIELKGVREELQTIFGPGSGILPGRVFTDAAFTRNSFYESLTQRYPVVHIASHFLFRPGDGSRSFLLLGDGTPLTIDELKGHKKSFEGVQLLTLSACNTAAQQANADGREIDGFAELAQRLGADAVMATLWPVSDNSTPQLMSNFYRLRERSVGMTKAEALRQAQLALLNGTTTPISHRTAEGLPEIDVQIVPAPKRGEREDDDPSRETGETIFVDERDLLPYRKDGAKPYAHPYFWAAFVLFGNSQ